MGPSLLKTSAVNFLSQQLLLKMLWELFKNNQWCFSSYHTENLKYRFISLFQVIFWDESTIAVLDDRMQTVLRSSDEEFLPAYLKKTVKILVKIMFGGNISLWTSRFNIIEPIKIRRSARETPASATVSYNKLRSGYLATISFSSRMLLHVILERSRRHGSGTTKSRY